ncbi:ABC transporter ATP-binding protein [Actinomyces oris]|nr:ABC transporter ATP-binding protein [Actinomyces oris]
MAPPAVEARDLCKSFPTPSGEPIEILHGISCTMMPGRMTALVGPSGSGKSTALLCLAGLEPATSGRVSLMGRDLGGLPAARVAELYRDRVGFVFQAYNLVPYLTVRENITISDTLAGRRPDSARVREVLAGLGLESRADAVATTLSGGEQQRVALGRVLYRRPPVVFADEPTGALDTHSAAFVLAELRRLADDGAAVILVTHDLGAAALAETVLIMRDGRIVDRRRGATPDELLAAVNQTGDAA